ncbi:MAG: Hpt domain-containing protein [Oligoflexia bacterium]|nr:Hpt domain-containing protein [Oligoflexia bacterium]
MNENTKFVSKEEYDALERELVDAERKFYANLEVLEEKMKKLSTLQKLSQLVFETRDLEVVFDKIVEFSVNVLEVEKTLILSLNEDGKFKVLNHKGYSRKIKDKISNVIIDPSNKYIVKLAANKEVNLVKDVETEFSAELGLCQIILCPIFNDKGNLSVIYVVGYSKDNLSTYKGFLDDDCNYFRLITDQITLAYQNISFTKNLEKLIKDRTQQLINKSKDIIVMLENLPQGIVSIIQGMIIHKEYSAYTEKILEVNDLAGKDAISLLFDNSSLGPDAISQIETRILSSIDEDKLNFELNGSSLPVQIIKKVENGDEKILDLTWTPICNHNNIIERLMVSIRDVTTMKELERLNAGQKKELEVVGKILNMGSSSFENFISKAHEYLSQNEKILKNNADLDNETIILLFRNMHTLKGSVRLYDLSSLVDTIHEAEQRYEDLRKNADAWEKNVLLKDLEVIQEKIFEYNEIYQNKLASVLKNPNIVSMQLETFEKIVTAIEKRNDNEFTKIVKNSPNLKCFSDAFSDILNGLASLAKSLEKERPTMVVHDGNVFFVANKISFLEDIFTHALRNSIDHGIETAKERISAKKAPAGTISISVRLENNKNLIFTIEDDGRGLPMKKLREKGVVAEIFKRDEIIADEDVAQLIFRSGISSAEKVTQISGRGVGMDAIKGMIEEKGGLINVEFLDKSTKGDDFRQFKIVMFIPNDNIAYKIT